MSRTFLVVAETRNQTLRQVSFETLQAAKLSSSAGDRIAAVLLGSKVGDLATGLISYGADQVYVIDRDELHDYQPEAYYAAIRQVIQLVHPAAVYFGHTAIGRDLAPQISAYLQAGQLSDIIDIKQEADEVQFMRPIYAGKAFETKAFKQEPWVVTIRPNNIAAHKNDAAGEGEVIMLDYSPPSLRTVIKEVVLGSHKKVDLTEAKIIVSGGRGVKSAEGFQPLEELAALLGGAVGASRAACDANYCDYSMQIGQTGKVVTPDIYIACGISGAIQHLAGMSQSKVIIAINKDPEAPIFKVADYGIVGDLFEVVPLLIEEFKKILN